MTTPDTLTLHPIGVMHTAHAGKVDAPRQPAAAPDARGIIELRADLNLQHAIEDLAGWERIWVIFWFNRNAGWRPKVLPPRSTTGRKGVLATRSPHRPNPLGLSVLRLERIEGLALHVRDVDLLDGTPILDIKPYVPYTDAFPESASGWLEPAAADPRAAWQVQFTAEAEAQLAWIAQHSALPLRERILATLSLGPQPHPYRRIRHGRNGAQLAVRDWRVDFDIASPQHIRVLRIRSGYDPQQLARTPRGPDDPIDLHQRYIARCSAG
ncbi:MAG: tRNA (N6-threonylcarbamoyladenosine(37)-N6)-methyltransferase TrmO [Nevskiaceae bacterium]|jgi:tRNA-Thr(GGU) m(6)t(6)A37 methyltransferase TsaA|nr:tRNA (N6-threonylcarbamoyladenosine(37)-N6)-methyltransferase TrmO [Nevskiaceae bacterium]